MSRQIRRALFWECGLAWRENGAPCCHDTRQEARECLNKFIARERRIEERAASMAAEDARLAAKAIADEAQRREELRRKWPVEALAPELREGATVGAYRDVGYVVGVDMPPRRKKKAKKKR